jgi:hypothetical protein
MDRTPESKHSEMANDLPASNSSSGSRTTRLTPETNSDDSDLDLGANELEHGIELRERDSEKARGSELYEEPDTEDDEDGSRLQRRASASTVHSFQLYTPDEERAVVRKFDRRLVLFVHLLYLLSFLDRSSKYLIMERIGLSPGVLTWTDIGNARIAGMQADLRLSSSQYAWVLTAFYLAYILFEPMSLLWKIIPAHIYVTIIVLSWGVTASLQSCSISFTTLIVLRTLLGIGEAGFTGIPFYLSFFFKREELALRTGFFIAAAPLATSFASTLAWVILKLADKGPIAPWRLLFLLEGFPSVLIAAVAWRVIPDGPGKAKFLSKREKKVAILRLRRDRAPKDETVGRSGLKLQEVWETVKDPKSYRKFALLM